MPIIEEFPKDDAYRLVKWVDKFTLPHLTTRSTSVTVRLQRLPFQRHSDLNRLTRESAAALLPLDRTDAGQAQYTSVAVHAGLLPHLAIGRVYQGQRLVGELPTRQATLTLADAELSCHEIKIGEELPAPAGWTYPYKQLLSREFGGIQTEFGASRCLVFVDASGIEYVIPRALIFQRFYAIQRELANAFTSGPWAQTRHRIVYEGQLKSGLETRIDPATGAWHVILQTHVDNDFARLAALLYFDDYAAARAESIYTGMLSDRRANVHAPWFASAQIPFRAEAKPLRLQVKGFMLPPRLGRREGGGKPVVHKQSFLVTSILGSSWPSYTPPIKAGRLNSGDKGKEQLPAQGDRPYANHLRARPAGSELVTTSATDASAAQGDAVTLEDTFSWLDGEEPEKLTKDRSQLYSDSDLCPAPPPPDAASGGERTHQGGNAAPAHHKVLVRDPVNRFRYLLDAFELLHSAGDLQRYNVFQPAISSQLAQCGGLSCWNFLDDMARRTGRWPSAGWRMLERARGVGTERTPGKPRCVLVVRIEVGTQLGYWFEIETRTTEGGVLSPLVASTGTDQQVAVSHLVESIARAEGRNLRQAMIAAAYEIGSDAAHCYKHHYKGDHNSEIDPSSLRRFLMKWTR
ncbi:MULTISPECIES: hypothetical protein [Xanthomonas]|jgi:hypothetical protein|uniref:hypothetical protein n=1 Tax=Xanthomonas TaxID=338 RepID=UPI00029C909E|nr:MULTISPECIES: hypothetical protein [Xanthomonas]EKU25244.1 hypothetical protein XTG29_01794 [Xanthomonas translucens pv. graminis ART-Xtg29]MCE4363511.1 hypothetical protein [Xanthomonas hortorum]OAX58821.1 hypothetical protein A6R72_03760 [Xanthomonas translucens pv. graminis]QUI81103.1 hypothetical protein ICA18_01910 [Xanthomonas arboricola pv. corylina]UKE54827.1 hypothetical protein KFS84_02620 [Xanthomonas translucens pv. graminis]